MARFEAELPTEIIKEFESLQSSCSVMIEEMTQAGAKTVYRQVRGNIQNSFRDSGNLLRCLKITKAYKTSDGSTSTKVGLFGYFKNKDGKTVPAPLVGNAREYGSASGEKKKPFLRTAFNKKENIRKAMLGVQKKYIGGDED